MLKVDFQVHLHWKKKKSIPFVGLQPVASRWRHHRGKRAADGWTIKKCIRGFWAKLKNNGGMLRRSRMTGASEGDLTPCAVAY